jgi:hypothetical protein
MGFQRITQREQRAIASRAQLPYRPPTRTTILQVMSVRGASSNRIGMSGNPYAPRSLPRAS